MTHQSHRQLEPERLPIMAAAFPECAAADVQVIAVTANGSDGIVKEFIAVAKGAGSGAASASLVTATCAIMYEDMTPSECCEYVFAEDPNTWAIAQLSRDALESYRGAKFESWKQMLLKPTCEAQFRRMLQIGIV